MARLHVMSATINLMILNRIRKNIGCSTITVDGLLHPGLERRMMEKEEQDNSKGA
jgi:hypothetical protein